MSPTLPEGKIHIPTLGVIVVLLAVLGIVLWYSRPASSAPSLTSSTTPLGSVSENASALVRTTPGIDTWYTNKTLRFSFRIPDGFTAPEVITRVPKAQVILLHNSAGDALLVTALPIAVGPSKELTEEGLRANLPGETITNIEENVIATVVTGLSFDTDSKEWGGDGVGFWFVNNNYLYELNTFKKDRELLDFVRSTWVFALPEPPPPKR